MSLVTAIHHAMSLLLLPASFRVWVGPISKKKLKNYRSKKIHVIRCEIVHTVWIYVTLNCRSVYILATFNLDLDLDLESHYHIFGRQKFPVTWKLLLRFWCDFLLSYLVLWSAVIALSLSVISAARRDMISGHLHPTLYLPAISLPVYASWASQPMGCLSWHCHGSISTRQTGSGINPHHCSYVKNI